MITQKMIEDATQIATFNFVTNPTKATCADAFEQGAKWAIARFSHSETTPKKLFAYTSYSGSGRVHFFEKEKNEHGWNRRPEYDQ